MSFGWTGPTMRAHVANKEGAAVKPTVKVKERGRSQQTWRSSSLEEWEEKWLRWHEVKGTAKIRFRWCTSSRPRGGGGNPRKIRYGCAALLPKPLPYL